MSDIHRNDALRGLLAKGYKYLYFGPKRYTEGQPTLVSAERERPFAPVHAVDFVYPATDDFVTIKAAIADNQLLLGKRILEA